MPNVHDGHRQRMRARYFSEGLDSFQPHEALEMLLFFAIPREDTNALAHRIIDHFGSLAAVMQAAPKDLMAVKGVGEQAATLISMILPMHRKYLSDKMSAPVFSNSVSEVGEYLVAYFADKPRESIAALFFDAGGRMVNLTDVSAYSTPVSCSLDTQLFYKTALNSNSVGAIIAHNHPGGTALPSETDISMTISISDKLRDLKIYLLDHIIVAGDDFISMAQSREYSRYVNSRAADEIFDSSRRKTPKKTKKN